MTPPAGGPPVIDLSRHGDVFVLTMHDGENRLSPTMLDAFDRALA